MSVQQVLPVDGATVKLWTKRCVEDCLCLTLVPYHCTSLRPFGYDRVRHLDKACDVDTELPDVPRPCRRYSP